ncbi:3-deoxy-manno-octulosonate cytidylyltransferase [Oleiphilus sp. HI0081]|jgi:3-deoxy-manno-octulosonate cytidylyltransferase (CMP-KDO synthetase)|nr:MULTISPECIES: 3-deoxy-manno-octulosonate cytidylyltransferase [unclassified Oleiphilus]KZY50240.1 3-deoxy-manno-octulosonate cytidylyltransferase [Oleiphilus sp. HI0050]KZY75631.1 3-deoxy-manno-octulosonate cytidylyltransferase [Oleiphilus sp. HI0069]KZY77099.1 3-deoxy-manno-octulosonate cytidylyltransferase [Oleiphilus sp. HI0068]KZY85545.1 3-deoxy-manno-octulosonate cytidylyltransferase [Oleiphilus sp. HI0072]KZZ08074.1 3-deoxy-manno-octulosonate cytidylyltransferase [Oleiphilus sp. HI007
MSFKVIIPARYASTRLPGKPLLDIAGKPMIQRVYEQACLSDAEEVVIATDDERIEKVALGFGSKVVMTSAEHPSGTDRLQEVVAKLALADDDIVVNVQGDEPLIPPKVINQVAKNLSLAPGAGIATLCESIVKVEDVFNPNAVKVVFDLNGMANYFSRAPIPWCRDQFSDPKALTAIPDGASYYRHIGIYAYRVGFLNAYVNWPPSMTEKLESLEQLRALSNGVSIHVEQALESPPPGVDTETDLQYLRNLLAV